MTTHTPGPWKHVSWGNTISIDTAEPCTIGIANINPRGDYSSGIPCSEDMANAALIATAPTLLSILKDLYAYWHTYINTQDESWPAMNARIEAILRIADPTW